MLLHPALCEDPSGAIAIRCVTAASWPAVQAALSPTARAFAQASRFEPKAGRLLVVPDDAGALGEVLFAVGEADDPGTDPLIAGKLTDTLPPGLYRFDPPPADARLATLAFLLGSYRFERYRKGEAAGARLVVPDGIDGAMLSAQAMAVAGGRDLINTPANDMGPAEIEAAARALAARHDAMVHSIVGEALLASGFPLIHAVGKASPRAPRLIDLTWGAADAPKLTLVGKGVAFDTGGLDIKPDSAMALMKKDMGGAATALALAEMVMTARLPVRLRLLVPAVENAVSGNAFRPGDVLPSRAGLTVEIGNTDAEGRLVLADALALADEEAPDLLLDFATLTGAARVALGPELPALFSPDDALAGEIIAAGTAEADPCWRLPLWRGYASMLDSKIADTNNVSGGPFAGSITAALFLARFVDKAKAWAHLDLYAWNPTARPARPFGGEVQTARAILRVLQKRYG